jgi:hypothetical protein
MLALLMAITGPTGSRMASSLALAPGTVGDGLGVGAVGVAAVGATDAVSMVGAASTEDAAIMADVATLVAVDMRGVDFAAAQDSMAEAVSTVEAEVASTAEAVLMAEAAAIANFPGK